MEFDYWPLQKSEPDNLNILSIGKLYKTGRIFVIYNDLKFEISPMRDVRYTKRNVPFLVTDINQEEDGVNAYQILQEEIIGWITISQNNKIDECKNT